MFTVMSFNVRGAVHDDGDNRWDQRADLNVKTILKAAPDVIGFQEFMQGNQADYERALEAYDYRLGPRVSINEARGTWEHPAIYWRRDRYSLLADGAFYLNETPEHYAMDWGTQNGRGLTWVRLRDQTADVEFAFVNTHFDHISGEARLKSARLVCREADRLFAGLPIIITGDFNTTPHHQDADGSAFDVFVAAGFRDAFNAATPEDASATTFHGFQGAAYPGPDGRIDWILYRDPAQRLTATQTAILRDAAPPLYPSDHYPVLTAFAWWQGA